MLLLITRKLPLGTKWTGTQTERQAVQNDFDRAENWGKINHRPIFMGEFGAYEKAEMNSRVLWTNYVARQAEVRSFSWAYWEFCAGFGVYDKYQSKWRSQLLKVLIP
ncbi:MAG TPA: hypothetical protein ENH29_11185 [Bacteroidetes bacterium]|nr:hypothetical protein [Bacteroidota bacterium]